MRYIATVTTRGAGQADRTIRRYANRKLYDPEGRRYVTLVDLARIIGKGDEVHVVDHETGEDLTTMVLAQILLEGIKERTASIPRQVLSRLIRIGFGPAGAAWADAQGPHEAGARAREEAERIASSLMAKGRLTLEEALALRQEIAASVHRLVGEAQRGIEGRLHRLLARSEREGGVSPSLQGLKERLVDFETYLAAPRPRTRAAAHPRRRGSSE